MMSYFMMSVTFPPPDMSTLRTVVAIVGKGFAAASFGTTVLYSSELYPTVIRCARTT